MLTSEMVSSVGTAIEGNVSMILPVCITLFALIFGITLLPKLIKRFTR